MALLGDQMCTRQEREHCTRWIIFLTYGHTIDHQQVRTCKQMKKETRQGQRGLVRIMLQVVDGE